MQDTELEFVELYETVRPPRGPTGFDAQAAHFGAGPTPKAERQIVVTPYLRIGHPAGTVVALKDRSGGEICVPWHHVKSFRLKADAVPLPVEDASPEKVAPKPPPPGPARMREEPHTLKV